MTSLRVSIEGTAHVAEARRAAVERARELGFDDTDAGRVALVATELATNIAQHARDGEIIVSASGAGAPAIELLAIDKGPGIADIARASEDGYSTAGTLGHGLGIVGRQADEFEIYSREPGGTVAVARVWRAKSKRDRSFVAAGLSVAVAGEPVCGDAWAFTWRNSLGVLLVVDGLGHGVGASEAALQAVRTFESSGASSPPALVEELHHALRPTRGAALAVAAVDLDNETLKYSGLGNVGASIVTPEGKRASLVSQNGTAGHAARRVTEFSYPFRTESILVMFTDGLTSSWDASAYPALWSCDPAIIAGVLYRDCSRRRDDVTVVAGKLRNPAT